MAAKTCLSHADYTVGWICALPLEMAAAKAMLDDTHEDLPVQPNDHNAYVLGHIGKHNIVVACLPNGEYGIASATTVAMQLLSSFHSMRFGLMVGIGGGVPNQDADIRLGDIVVSKPTNTHGGVVQYDYGKALRGGDFQRTGMLNRPPQILLTALSKLQASHLTEESQVPSFLADIERKLPKRAANFSRPTEADHLYLSDYIHINPRSRTCDGCDAGQTVSRPFRNYNEPAIHYGLIASANQVVKDSQLRDKLSRELGVYCVEMEAAGLMNNYPCVVVRGICDYADSHKNKDWQGYAAAVAAAYAKELLLVTSVSHIGQTRTVGDSLSDSDKRCLQDLLLTNPDDDRRRIEEMKGGLLDDSFRWILDNKEYQEWRASPQSQLLWIKGDAGKGKTMLMIGVIKELLQQVQPESSESLAYFLCQGTSSQLNNATAVLRGLIYLLISQQPHLISHLRERYDREGKKMLDGENAFYSLSAVFENMVQDQKQATTYLLVDALDECQVDLSDLLRLIAKTISMPSVSVKWIVSSRNIDHIEQILDPGREGNKLSLELNADHISSAVEKYIDYKVSRLRILGDDEKLRERVRDQLRQKSDGTFLWVALVVQELHKCQLKQDISYTLTTTPAGLPNLYEQMIRQIQQLEAQHRDRCLTILSTVVLAYRPLHLLEMRYLTEMLEVKDLESVVGMCGSFLTIRDEYVYLIHQSAKDHLNNNIDASGHSTTHYRMFSKSLRALSNNLRRNIYDLSNAGVTVSDITALRPNPDPLTALRYSCTFWLDHFLEVDPRFTDKAETTENGVISGFFAEHLLHWLESLSLIGEVPHAIWTLRKLVYQGQAKGSPQSIPISTSSRRRFLNKFFWRGKRLSVLKEAETFANNYGSIIQEAPLQTYGAALIFCPQKSEIKRLYWGEKLDFIKHVFGIQEWWDPCVQTLEGHTSSVKAVVFSPNGQILASASDDKTIRLWDAATGALKRTLEGHTNRVNTVVFSPNGRILASASDDETIRLWDVATGALKRTLEGHTSWVKTVTFSPNGRMLASASDDKTIRLWDAATGVLKRTLEGHTNYVKAVVFSLNGQILASASFDETVRLWDIATGALKRILEGHTHWVQAVTFSPNGRMLASASFDETVRLWDAATGALKRTLKGHTSSVKAVVFSPNDQMLASASDDKTIRLWDAATGALKRTLEGHTSSVNTVTFSPNGQMLASASVDETIRLWDAATGALKRTLEGHTNRVKTVTYLPNGQMVASTSVNKTIQLWDAATGALKRTLEGHTDYINAVAFSPNGQMLASASVDDTIRLWDTATGALKRTLEGHISSVNTVVFSPNGQILASASDDGTIRVWDAATGALKRTLEGHTSSVNTVVFSPNGQILVSASFDKTIRLWDAATGALKQTLKGHTSLVNTVVFSPNGQILVSASFDKTIRLWDAATGALKQTLEGHTDYVNAVASSDDGHHLNTDHASISLKSSELVHTMDAGSGLLVHEKWITRDGQKLIWLPPDRRATCVAASDNTVALGHASGHVTCLKFNPP